MEWIFIGAWVVCGMFAAMVASSKGYSGGSWFVFGILFGVLALLAAIGIADKGQKPISRETVSFDGTERRRTTSSTGKDVLTGR